MFKKIVAALIIATFATQPALANRFKDGGTSTPAPVEQATPA